MRRRQEASPRLTKSIHRLEMFSAWKMSLAGESTLPGYIGKFAGQLCRGCFLDQKKDPHKFEFASLPPKWQANFETLSQEMFGLEGNRQTNHQKTIPETFGIWPRFSQCPVPSFSSPKTTTTGDDWCRQPPSTKSLCDGQTQTEWLGPNTNRLMAEILHQLLGGLSHDFFCFIIFIHPCW